MLQITLAAVVYASNLTRSNGELVNAIRSRPPTLCSLRTTYAGSHTRYSVLSGVQN